MKRLLVLIVLTACADSSTETPATPPDAPPAAPPAFSCTSWQTQESGTDASFRGLNAVSADVAWVSGTGGTWGRTVDGGATWQMTTVPGAEELDFRDVDAFDHDTAYLMSAGPGELSRIFKTTDGGESWQLQHTNPGPDGFFDGMAFWDADRGLVYGDPVGGHFFILATTDGGTTWTRPPTDGMPPALPEEAGFAASGSGLTVGVGGLAWFGSGGPEARVFRSIDYGQTWTVTATPILAGEGSTGIFSLAFHDEFHGVAVGGDYTQPEATAANAARTTDGGLTWTLIETAPPAGYRSAVVHAPGHEGRVVITVGTSGSDLSLDGGASWSSLSTDNFNSISFADGPCTGWAAGPDGRIARITD